MTRPWRRAARITSLVILASCTSEDDLSLPAPPPGFPAAYAMASCAPSDGPAVQLYLAPEPAESLPPPAPFVEVAVWQGKASLSGRRIEWSGPSSEGMARRCDATGACIDAATVDLRFRPVGADSSMTGALTLGFTDGSTVSGGFNARWRSARLLCG